MKTKVLKVAVFALIAIAAGVNYYCGRSKVALSDLALANVDALANDEKTPCEGARHCTQMTSKQCWYYNINGDGNMMVSCYDNQVHRGQD